MSDWQNKVAVMGVYQSTKAAVIGLHGCAETVGEMDVLVAGVEQAYKALA